MSLPKFKFYRRKETFNQALDNGNIQVQDICFIADTREIFTQGVYITGDISKEEVGNLINNIPSISSIADIPDFPLPTAPNQVLTSTGSGVNMEWTDLTQVILDTYTYGVEWKPNVADPVLTRVGNMNYHKTLPIQSGMKGCIYNPKEKKVVYWLHPDNWEDRLEPIELVEAGFHQGGEDHVLVPASYYNLVGKYSRIIIDGDLYGTVTDKSVVGSDNLFDLTVQWDNIDEVGQYLYAVGDSASFSLGSNLAGYDGEVFVYVPEFYIKSWDEPDRRCVRISPIKIDETWEHQPAVFLSAYRNTILNTVPENMGYLSTLEVNTAISVANDATYCRGGGNRAANDTLEDIYRRDLGKCRTGISRSVSRTYARKAGKEIMSYRQYKNIMYWLWVIEYANFNSQATYEPRLNAEGFHQGGMGPGLTNMQNWANYNSYYAIAPNGFTNEFGNYTGVKDLVIPEFTYGSENTVVPTQTLKSVRWRGIEDPFGHTFHNVDGIIIDADADNHPNNMNYIYTTDDPSKYGDTAADIANMVLSGLEVHTDGYIKEWDLGTTAEIIPKLIGGNTTQYKCDYHWTGGKNTTLRTLLLGGSAVHGGLAGLSCFYSHLGVGASIADVGFRTSCVAN